MRTHKVKTSKVLATLAICILATPSLRAEGSFESLLETMQERQTLLESELKSSVHCLGERLDGLVEINANCSTEARNLAEAENADRQALHGLMAAQLQTTSASVGEERAQRYQERYNPGILREISLSSGKTTWWDGYPPRPTDDEVSRILSLNNARIHSDSDANSSILKENIQQYESFGVIESATGSDGNLWYKVTEDYVPKIKPAGWSPRSLGWISEKESIPWRRALVMRFTNRLERPPSIFFREPDPAIEMSTFPISDRADKVKAIEKAITDKERVDSSVIAIEPNTNRKLDQAIFYPVLDYHARQSGKKLRIDGKFARLLEVAARTRSEGSGGYTDKEIPIDVVFVMDTTYSMKPYFEKTIAALEDFVSNGKGDGIRFGFIGYQDSNPGFSYQVKEFTKKVESADEFVGTLKNIQVRNTPVKGDDIPEAVFEGLDAALESTAWRDNSIKITVLVGDAPGKIDNLTPEVLTAKAFTQNINIFSFHIGNPKVSSTYNAAAKKHYSDLSTVYMGAQGKGSSQQYMVSVDAGADAFQSTMFANLNEAQESFDNINKCLDQNDCALKEGASGDISNLIFRQAQLLMPDESLPDQEVRGWVFDTVLDNPSRKSLAPMILLSESELNELTQRVAELKEIGEQALRGEGGTKLDFFDLVSTNSRFTMVDPTAVNFRDAFSVPLGIDELPYESDIMSTTREEFGNSDTVLDFVRSMTNKLRIYEELKRKRGNKDVWKRLSAGASERDMVVALELDFLP